jgi:hypothetical protein
MVWTAGGDRLSLYFISKKYQKSFSSGHVGQFIKYSCSEMGQGPSKIIS